MVKIKVDDKVVVKKPNYTDKEEQVCWMDDMDDYENSILTVSDIDPTCSNIFQVEGIHWWFHPNWVTHVNGVPVNKEKPYKSKPSKQERPYENWKMSISRSKYVRCISGNNILDYQNVEGIVGFLNKDENMFYYVPSTNKYIAAKVYPFKYPDDTEGWEFVKENCDSLQKSVIPEVNAVLTKCDDEKSDILEAVESTKNGILASFGLPTDTPIYNPVKNISLEKYQRCVAKAIKQINYFNQSGELTWMFKSPCENYYYWCDYNSKNDVIYFRGEVDWVEKNYRKDNPEQRKKLADLAEKLKNSYSVVTDPAVYELAESLRKEPKTEWTDKHYNFNYTLTEEDIEKGVIKIDPYFVNEVWRLNSKDSTGIVFHCLKTLARWCDKHEEEREIRAVLGQMKRLAQMRRIDVK